MVAACGVSPFDAPPVSSIHFALPALNLHHTSFVFFTFPPLLLAPIHISGCLIYFFLFAFQSPPIFPFIPQSFIHYHPTAPNMSKPIRGWNDQAHTALLICLLDEVKGGKAVITKATERLNQMGYQYSYDAVKYCCPPAAF